MRVFSSNILFLSKYLVSITCSNVLFRNFARTMLMFSRDICDVFLVENISIARAKFRNRTLLQVMETRYLLRNKIFEENTRIFGPPMLKLVILHHFSKNIESLKKKACCYDNNYSNTSCSKNIVASSIFEARGCCMHVFLVK